MTPVAAALSYLTEHRDQHLSALYELLSIPSVSMDPAHRADMVRAAEWLATRLRHIGMHHTEIVADHGLPLVYSEWIGAKQAPTLLIYGHYDVQPADPVAEWHTPPFAPSLVGENLYARGASDDKGQVMAVIFALSSWLQTSGRLPVNVKLIIEGEEEVSSTLLHRFVADQAERLRCDAVLLVDSMMLSPQQPLILYGTRGNCYLEVTVRGPKTDLHSGTFGGMVDNPFNVLVRLLAALQDGETRRVWVPGFYQKVRIVDDEERAFINRLPVSDVVLQALTGVPALAGEEGFTPLERASIRPTFDIHGISGGFIGPGKKTVIPAQARAKLSMRLVPHQDPVEIGELVRNFLQQQAPSTVQVSVEVLSASWPVLVDYRHPTVQVASTAFAKAFGRLAAFSIGGGTLPIAATFQKHLQAPLVITGFGLPDDNLHAPNEKIFLPCLFGGSAMIIHYLAELADAYASW